MQIMVHSIQAYSFILDQFHLILKEKKFSKLLSTDYLSLIVILGNAPAFVLPIKVILQRMNLRL